MLPWSELERDGQKLTPRKQCRIFHQTAWPHKRTFLKYSYNVIIKIKFYEGASMIFYDSLYVYKYYISIVEKI
jgi:hypothetical protein